MTDAEWLREAFNYIFIALFILWVVMGVAYLLEEPKR